MGTRRNSGNSDGSPFGAAVLALLQETLAGEGCFRWRLRGSSMMPTLPLDCQIEIAPLPARVRLGEVLVFAAGDALIAHRLVRRSRGRWITQGDGRRAPDPPLRPEQALGVVRSACVDGRQVWPGRGEFLWRGAWVGRFYLLLPLRAARRAVKQLRRL